LTSGVFFPHALIVRFLLLWLVVTKTTNSVKSDGNGKLSRENLDKMTLAELYIFKDAIEKSQPKTFISVMRDAQEVKTKPKTQGTVGSYNQDTGKYEGGL